MAMLINNLHRLTLQNKLEWRQTERDDVFQVSFPDYAVRLSVRQSRQQSDALEYVVSLVNDVGDMIDQVGDEDFEDRSNYGVLKEMYEMARRSALGVDQALDSILSQLRRL
jgi:hypothetical protein